MTLVDLLNKGCSEELIFASALIPGSWWSILGNIVGMKEYESYHPTMSATIRKVAECILHDVDRKYCKCSEYWHISLKGFIHLISRLVLSKNLVAVLVEIEGIVELMISAIFYGTHHSDIVRESKSFLHYLYHSGSTFLLSCDAARFIICVLGFYKKINDKVRIAALATIPVVSNAQGVTSNLLFMFELINLIKVSAGQDKPFNQRRAYLVVLSYLAAGGCVDKSMSADVITLGYSVTPTYGDAAGVALVMSTILIPHLNDAKRGSLLKSNKDDDAINVTQPDGKYFATALDGGKSDVAS